VTETDDHGGQGEIDRLIRSPVLDGLETAYGVERAFSASEVGGFRLGCVWLEDDPDKPVALIVPDGKDWRVVAQFEWSPPALRAIGLLLDEHWDEVPVDRPGHPSPTLVIACEQALEVVYRTSEGVRDGRELFDEPGSVNNIDPVWAGFRSATSDLADWAEHTP
jgi:hypothetical protein